MKTFHKILIILIMQLLCIQQNIFAQDTIVVSKPVKQNMLTNDTISVTKPLGQNVSSKDTSAVDRHVKQIFKPEPLRATMLAVAFPGLGQIYNRKYWKIPVVYVGFGALVYSAGFNGKNYNLYMKAYQDFTDNILATNSYLKVISPSADRKLYDPLFNPTGYDLNTYASYKEAMLRMVDYYKRYRDLSYIGIAGWYLISILDANVDASLYNYEVNNNLNITLAPIPMSLPGGFIGAGLSVDLKVNF